VARNTTIKQAARTRRLAAYFLDATLAMMLAATFLLWIYPKFFPHSLEILGGGPGKMGAEFLLQRSDGERLELLHLLATTQFVVLGTFTLYFWLSEISSNGGSLGKCIFRLRVSDIATGGRPSPLRLLLRSAASSICLVICSPFLLPNFLCALFRSDNRCFHDIVSGTCVVGD
jgi:uncharacterized RDD family membrane protein YckC